MEKEYEACLEVSNNKCQPGNISKSGVVTSGLQLQLCYSLLSSRHTWPMPGAHLNIYPNPIYFIQCYGVDFKWFLRTL